MPKLKQPVSLKDAAMDVLLVFCANYCDKHSKADSLGKIRQGVTFMKEDMCLQMPPYLEAEFCYELMKKFLWSSGYTIERPKIHIRAVAEVMMDRKIIGLKCTYKLLDFLEPDDTRRILGLKELDLGFNVTHILTNFHLEDIRKFVYGWNCTDFDLKIIGQTCRKLLHLNVSGSRKVTEVSMRTLSGCPDLQFVYVAACSVSGSGVIEFLSANKRIREFHDDRRFDLFSLPDSSVYPYMESLDFRHYSCPNGGGLRFVREKSPNLKSLVDFRISAEDLEELKYLKLSKITLDGWNDF